MDQEILQIIILFLLLWLCLNCKVPIDESDTVHQNFSTPVAGANSELSSIKTIYKTGYITTRVNVRTEPDINSEILEIYDYNTEVEYIIVNKDWNEILYNNDYAYIASQYISDTRLPDIQYKEYNFSGASTMKSWMPYTAITSKNSKQYQLQHTYAYTGNYGIRMIEDRYCVAVGSFFNAPIGQKFDLILENGEVIKCISADVKANKDTDTSNIFTNSNGCCSEFIVDKNNLNKSAKISGNISNIQESWNSKVVTIKVYDDNIFTY